LATAFTTGLETVPTTRFTVTVTAVIELGELRVKVPEYAPVNKAVGFAVTVMVAGVAPLVGEAPSHVPPAVATV
jgi:hypothetical protein